MADGPDANLYMALTEHLETFVPVEGALPFAFDNLSLPTDVAAKPTNYLSASFLPNETSNSELGDGQEQLRGLFQVSVFWESGAGLRSALNVVSQLIEHFAKGTTLWRDGLKVVIDRKPWAASPIQEDDRVQVPVTIQYHAFS